MKELRCIVFSDRELVASVIDRRKRLREPLPSGDILGVRFDTESGIKTFLKIADMEEEMALPEEEVQAALITLCMTKNIPLPADSEKTLYVIRGHATLMITMNFKKGARIVAKATVG